jgi:hypothetical protein
MSLTGDLQSGGFTDPQYGMVSLYDHNGLPGPNCANYWLFTAQAFQLGYFNLVKQIRFWKDATVLYSGLFSRWPSIVQDISKDEIIGAATLSQIFAELILSYGLRSWWSFDLQRPMKFTWKYWIGRYPDVAPYVFSRAGRNIWFGAQLSWAIGCVLSTFGSGTDGRILMMVQIPWMRRHPICAAAGSFWKWRMKKQYPGGPRALRTVYFPAGHPLIAASAPTWDGF